MRRALAAALLVLALGACARDEARPEGIAERWLQAVSERGRDGLREDAEERMAEYGTAAPIEVPDAEDDERTFRDLEVGKATEEDGGTFVPFRVTARIEGDEKREVRGALRLSQHDGEWRVAEVLPARPDDKLPSEGGERPARSKLSQWALALVAGLVLTVGAVVVIERQPHPAQLRH